MKNEVFNGYKIGEKWAKNGLWGDFVSKQFRKILKSTTLFRIFVTICHKRGDFVSIFCDYLSQSMSFCS